MRTEDAVPVKKTPPSAVCHVKKGDSCYSQFCPKRCIEKIYSSLTLLCVGLNLMTVIFTVCSLLVQNVSKMYRLVAMDALFPSLDS